MGYVIFVGKVAGDYELEWPECGAFWSAFHHDRSYMVSGAIIDKNRKRAQKAPHRAILARKPR